MLDLPITEAREQLTSMPKRLTKRQDTLAITKHGKPVLALMPWDLYESLMETLEILDDEKFMKALRKGIKEIKAGKGIPFEEVKKRLYS